jgi:16S rRNA processing protein RimM
LKERPEYVIVGRFGRPRGVSGEISIVSLSDNPERFHKEVKFWIESEPGFKRILIASIRFISGKPIATIEGYDNREKVTELTNKYLYIRSADLAKLPEGSYYIFDLIGCCVVDKDNRELGQVCDVESYPANDVWIIESKNGVRHLFPAVAFFIDTVDIEKKRIVINPPEGIFDSPDEN